MFCCPVNKVQKAVRESDLFKRYIKHLYIHIFKGKGLNKIRELVKCKILWQKFDIKPPFSGVPNFQKEEKTTQK